jgi:hypothetical protein
MRFKSLFAVGFFLATLALAGCSDKATDPQNSSQVGNGVARAEITSIIGDLTITDGQCYFITPSPGKTTYELVFTKDTPPDFKSGTSVIVSGYLLNNEVTEDKCNFNGPQLLVQSISTNNVGSARQNTSVDQQ